MRLAPRRLVRIVSEALIILPMLALALVWAGVVLAGLMDQSLVGRHMVEIRQLLTGLLIICLIGFIAGALGFMATREDRRPED